ncbi:hypothetical protein SAMN05216276_108711 [Streptosporangium subroseum]|uniref:Uncharacterized protein n=1 Tax=Streptosporangium subroseum TaxID=106412 RepID=A0A239P6Q9_9ACTN|nr:hypothetical protein [Streptosporangium subroseum]SNT62029.1 hypothetical protein SAMN05216276_108711 [Streptosporangium subroseum]
MVGRELEIDQVSLTGAVLRMREPVDLFGQHADALLQAVAGGERSAWGIGVIGMAMDQVNERLSQACGHLHSNLCEIGTSIQAMADQAHAAELADVAAIRAVGQNLDPPTRWRSV